VPYLSALEVWSRQGAIQIHVYLYLTFRCDDAAGAVNTSVSLGDRAFLVAAAPAWNSLLPTDHGRLLTTDIPAREHVSPFRPVIWLIEIGRCYTTRLKVIQGHHFWYQSNAVCNFRSSSTNQLLVPSYRRSTIGRRAFPIAGARVWNNLPSDVTSAPSLAVFGRRLKAELFHRCYNAAWLFLTLTVVLEIDFLFRPL